MAENTAIEWCDHTFNPWIGCTRVSTAASGGGGCDNCYAAVSTPARAMKIEWQPGAPRHRTAPSTWKQPKTWNDRHAEFFAQHGRRQRVFCASLADVFDNVVDPAWRTDLFALIRSTPNLDWLLLTKRIGNAHEMIGEALINLGTRPGGAGPTSLLPSWPWPNVWLGATLVSRLEMLRDAAKLKATPAAVRFWSVEPMLGDFGELPPGLLPDWVICGGESGPGARPMHPDWARGLRDQCAAAGVPFLFKQWGEWAPWEDRVPLGRDWAIHAFADGRRVQRCGKKAAGRLLDGRTHDGFPR